MSNRGSYATNRNCTANYRRSRSHEDREKQRLRDRTVFQQGTSTDAAACEDGTGWRAEHGKENKIESPTSLRKTTQSYFTPSRVAIWGRNESSSVIHPAIANARLFDNVIAYHVFVVSTNQTTGVNTEKGGEKLEVTPLHYSGVLAGEEPNDWFPNSLAWWLAICMFGVRSEACAYVRNSTKPPQHMARPPRDWSCLAMISG
jgi:hypothetical protein